MLRQSIITVLCRSASLDLSTRHFCGSPVQHNISRVIVREPFYQTGFRLLRKYLWRVTMAVPPYNHVTQVGDPVLRGKSAPVDPEEIKTKPFQDLVQRMVDVMRKTGGVGLAGPQIGVAKQVFVMEFTEKHFKGFPEDIQKAREMAVVPLKVFVNPQLKVTSDKQIVLPEGCLSLTGFTAATPRAHEVEVTGDERRGIFVSINPLKTSPEHTRTGLDEKAQPVTWRVSGYPARILQHEYDHLQGTLYIDHMDTRTFTDLQWPKWNEK